MMEEILAKVLVTIAGIATSGLITWLTTQIVKYKKLIKKEEDETIKITIVNTLNDKLDPIQNDIGTMKIDIANVQNDIGKMKSEIKNLQNSEVNFTTRLTPMQDEIEHLKDDITIILDDLKEQGLNLQNICEKEKTLEHETRCAWRYRIRTLCHAYLRRGWMSHDEFAQLQEMLNLYVAIGGNGQTKELYDRTLQVVEQLSDAEIAVLENNNK